MIRINKPHQVPNVLAKKGKAKRRGLCSAYSRYANDYRSGAKKFKFDSAIYGHKTVKTALIEAQHGKCSFCESRITHIAYGDVEHFRPKAGYRQLSSDELGRPGYYWLAYEWDNLFLSCQLCNQRFKKNFFPLLNPLERATSHRDDFEREEPLFINPAADDPEEFISFREEIPYAIDDNPRGKATIEMLGLDRNELNEVRLDSYERLRLIYHLAYADPPQPESEAAKAFLNKAVQTSSQYASMARAAIAARFSIL